MRFWGTHPGEVNGPPWWANRKLFEAVRPRLEQCVNERSDCATFGKNNQGTEQP
jgi:hypothetical protein